MDQNELAVRLFMFASAVPLGIEAAKSVGRSRVGFAFGTGAFVLMGIFWSNVASVSPKATQVIGEIALSPSSWFILAVAAILLIRIQRLAASTPLVAHAALSTDKRNAKLDDDIASVRHAVARLNANFDDLRGDLTSVSSVADESREKLMSVADQADITDAKADAARSDTKVLGERLDALVAISDKLLQSRFAQRTEIALRRIESEILRLDSVLYFPEGRGLEAVNWEAWQNSEIRWRAAVRNWSLHGRNFVEHDLMSLITSTPQDDFYGTWSFVESALPDANTVHRYKAFCIMRRNFQTVKEEVDGAVWRAAYG